MPVVIALATAIAIAAAVLAQSGRGAGGVAVDPAGSTSVACQQQISGRSSSGSCSSAGACGPRGERGPRGYRGPPARRVSAVPRVPRGCEDRRGDEGDPVLMEPMALPALRVLRGGKGDKGDQGDPGHRESRAIPVLATPTRMGPTTPRSVAAQATWPALMSRPEATLSAPVCASRTTLRPPAPSRYAMSGPRAAVSSQGNYYSTELEPATGTNASQQTLSFTRTVTAASNATISLYCDNDVLAARHRCRPQHPPY